MKTVNIVAVLGDARTITKNTDSFKSASEAVVEWSKDSFYTGDSSIEYVFMSDGIEELEVFKFNEFMMAFKNGNFLRD